MSLLSRNTAASIQPSAPWGMKSAPMSASTMSSMLPVSRPSAWRPFRCVRSASLRNAHVIEL